MPDILDQIDAALVEWDVSVSNDAMRWRPVDPPWDEPIVRDPRGGVDQLLAEGLDGYAARAYVGWLAKRQYEAAIEASQTIGRALQRAFEDMARNITEAFKKLVESAGFKLNEEQLAALAKVCPEIMAEPNRAKRRAPMRSDRRPAWQSPYGPAPRRRR